MKKVLIILATLVGVIALGNVLVAGAQTGGALLNSPMGAMMSNTVGIYTGTMPFGYGMHGGVYSGTVPFAGQMHDQMSQMNQKVLDAVAAQLGLTSSDLLAALQTGQTLTDLAKSKNVSLSDLQSVADAARKAVLDDLVKQNVITQQQEDFMLAHMQDMRILGFGGMPGFGFGGGPRGHMPFGMPNGNGPKGFMPHNGMHHFGFPNGSQPQQPSTAPSTQG